MGDIKIVRCKNCKYNIANQAPDPYDITDYTDITCTYFMTDGMSAEDFCSRGEEIASEQGSPDKHSAEMV